MTALRKVLLSAEEYLTHENAATYRSEFYLGEVFAIAGGTVEHSAIASNLQGQLFIRLMGSGCRVVGSDQRVRVASNSLITYPDLAIICGKAETDPLDKHSIINPVTLIEVLSPSTEGYDRGAKFQLYQGLRSLREYVVVSQSQPTIDRFVRQADGSWSVVSFVGLDAVLSFVSVRADVPLAEIYAGIAFDPPTLRPRD